jgi:Fe2+ or Zn2+ uptake regulation protein
MAKVEVLLGGKTRFVVLEALAEAKQPVTAYQIAISRGLDPAATYRCLTEFSEFGIVESEMKERNQTFYKLSEGIGKAASEFLRSLKQKISEPIDLENWISPEIRAERMAKIVRININQFDKPVSENVAKRKDITDLMSKRISGELSVLIASSQIAFKELFDKKDDTFILKT